MVAAACVIASLLVLLVAGLDVRRGLLSESDHAIGVVWYWRRRTIDVRAGQDENRVVYGSHPVGAAVMTTGKEER